MNDDRCAKCNGIVDRHGISSALIAYCDCVCRWPKGGCGARIYFLINLNQNVQPFTLSTGLPHHRECPPFAEWKAERRRIERAAKRIEDDVAVAGQKSLEAFP